MKSRTRMNDNLIIKYLLKETSPEETTAVREWISSSSDNAKEFSRFEVIWNTSKQLGNNGNINTDQAWSKFRERVKTKADAPAVRLISQRNWLKVAAVLLLVAGAWSFYSVLNTEYEKLETGALVRTELLPDGSEVTLNRNTLMSYQKDFKGSTRSVRLKRGEAFFKVSADKAKPFIIEADNVMVTVVGTSFNVKHLSGNTEVIVETGVVQVSMGSEHVTLKGGEKVWIKGRKKSLRKESTTDQLHNYYRSKVFVANDTPLWRLVEILNEAYDSNIVIGNDDIRNLPLNATFTEESLDNVLNVITMSFKIRAVKEGDRIVLK